ncbi:MAG TPA: hypothetical protein DIV57_15825 [Stenotrophomonas sp.]|jgi:hypothetical protein|uniref:hypothetical protein n=1 Tax=unclassified Stenotrophomonas TaxID=196198 RepID=UPI000DE76FA0|nr:MULTISPECIES: hypothetical protein [unclassified Stenotrophomonas]PWB28913.1 hypothetical protein DCO49_04200 [Stenotrophomonas sp. SPM]HCR34828.1 hypothetical protein [Stenotrophomonas sp.]
MDEIWCKRQVRIRLGLETDAELARLFGISRSAVSQWPCDFPIPPLRRYMLQQRYPGLFPAEKSDQVKTI